MLQPHPQTLYALFLRPLINVCMATNMMEGKTHTQWYPYFKNGDHTCWRNHLMLATCDGDKVTMLRNIYLKRDTASKLNVAPLEMLLTSLLSSKDVD